MSANAIRLFPNNEQMSCSDHKGAEGENVDLRFMAIGRICSENSLQKLG